MLNPMNLMTIIGMARTNPQQAVMQLLQNGVQTGRINQAQYNLLTSQLQGGANPNMIIQQMMSSGMVNQQMYENARQNANMFRK